MRYPWFTVVLIVLFSGCEPPHAQPPKAQPVPPAAGPIQAIDATGVWNQSQVEEFLRQELELTTIAIQSTGGDGYQGTGKDKEGTEYTLVVKQVPGGIKVEWSHESGNGKITFGNPVP